MYVLDTNVVSELRKAKAGKADRKVTAWAAGVPPSSLFLSVITILELETGTAPGRAARTGAGCGAARLVGWSCPAGVRWPHPIY